jgi:Holliday junction resolvasome RuvABC endonuclease subunit
MRILCIDPSLRNTGWAVIEYNEGEVLDCGVICTKSTPKKTRKIMNMYVSEDSERCYREMAAGLEDVCYRYGVDIVCFESATGSKSVTAAKAMAAAQAIVAAVAQLSGLPTTQVQPRRVKEEICSNPAASKEMIEMQVKRIYPDLARMIADKGILRSKHEHIYDACAIGVAAMTIKEESENEYEICR